MEWGPLSSPTLSAFPHPNFALTFLWLPDIWKCITIQKPKIKYSIFPCWVFPCLTHLFYGACSHHANQSTPDVKCNSMKSMFWFWLNAKISNSHWRYSQTIWLISPILGIRIPEITSSNEFLFSNLFSKVKNVSLSVNYLLITRSYWISGIISKI